MVERAAHNGFVVGSNPTKPKEFIYKVKFCIKNYKLLKTKKIFKGIHFFLIYNTTNSSNNINLNKNLKRFNLEHYKLKNNITKQILKNSLFKNYKFLIKGLVILIFPKTDVNLKKLKTLSTLIGIKLNNKIYSINQIDNLNSLNYNQNCLNFLKTIKRSLKTFKKLS